MKKKSILLVEDDFLNRRLSNKILLEYGYVVFEAKNSKEAVDILKSEDISLVILDINLGKEEKEGIVLGQHIRDQYGIPFIYLTAYESSEIINSAIATSPYSYLTKPFKTSDFIASIEIAIQQTYQKYSPKILVKDADFVVPLSINEINYIESEGNYLLFYTNDKLYKSRSTIKQVIDELSDSIFIQVHRAYVVNKTKIEKFRGSSVIVSGKEIPVSKSHLEKIVF